MDNFRNTGNFHITRLLMQETGTYNPMFSRPFTTDMNGGAASDIAARVGEFGLKGIQPLALGGAAMSFMKPSATPDAEIVIPYGWQERRIRFVMEVIVDYATGTRMSYFLQGYTDFPGVSQNGNVSPDMTFIINSLVGVSKVTMNTPFGLQAVDKVVESSQILVENRFSPSHMPQAQRYTMRPQDVFVGMHSAYLRNSYQVNNEADFMDSRLLLRSEPVLSSRGNNVSANYVAKVIDANTMGRELSDWGQDDGDILTRSRGYAMGSEKSLLDNPVIRRLSELSNGMGVKNTFTFGDFERLDMNVRNVTDFITLGGTMQIGSVTPLHQAGQTEYWVGSDLITQQATIISQSIPALMMELLISKVDFVSTNHTLNCQIDTRLMNAMTLTSADLRQNYDIFIRRLEAEILTPMCFGGQESFTLDMRVDMFGETWINLSIGASPPTQFVIPSFCDTLCSPVVTQNQHNFENLVHDFDVMLTNVGQAQASSPVGNMVFNPNV